MDNEFIRRLNIRLARAKREYETMLERERMQFGTANYDPFRIAYLEDALDDVEYILDALSKMNTE